MINILFFSPQKTYKNGKLTNQLDVVKKRSLERFLYDRKGGERKAHMKLFLSQSNSNIKYPPYFYPPTVMTT